MTPQWYLFRTLPIFFVKLNLGGAAARCVFVRYGFIKEKTPWFFNVMVKKTSLIAKIANDISSPKKVSFFNIPFYLTIFWPSKLWNSLLQFLDFLVLWFKLSQENFCRWKIIASSTLSVNFSYYNLFKMLQNLNLTLTHFSLSNKFVSAPYTE